ncbi:MAG: murein hydrolase activator EnvC [Gammaproteobacteria bacterium]
MTPERPRARRRVLALCLLLVAASPVSAADDPRKASAELTELRARIGVLQDRLQATRTQESTLATQVREIEQRIGARSRELRAVQARLADGERRLDALQADYTRTQTQLAGERQGLARQLRAAYLLGRQEQVKLLLNQEDPARLGRVLTYYHYFNQTRLARIEKVETLLVRLAELQDEIGAQRTELARSEVRQTAELTELAQARLAREALLERLKADIRAQGGELAQMQRDEQRLEQLIGDLQRALAELAPEGGSREPFAKLKRRLPWPVTGRLVAGFGERRDLGDLRWRGAFIAAPADQAVHSVAHGRVAFADWLRGFGLLIIIDHGDDYMTLYGHNQSLFKEVGDWVTPGEVIASVGDTGGVARSGVYFELRHKGEPQNPQGWFAGRPDAARAAR